MRYGVFPTRIQGGTGCQGPALLFIGSCHPKEVGAVPKLWAKEAARYARPKEIVVPVGGFALDRGLRREPRKNGLIYSHPWASYHSTVSFIPSSRGMRGV